MMFLFSVVISRFMAILTGRSWVTSPRHKVVVAIGAGSSGAVVPVKLCAIVHAQQSCQGDAPSSSERAEFRMRIYQYPRTLYGRAACFLPACPTHARCCSTPARRGIGEGTMYPQQVMGQDTVFPVSLVLCSLRVPPDTGNCQDP